MKVLSYTALTGFNFDKIYSEVLEKKPTEIHFLSETEWEFRCDKDFIDSIKKLGIKIKLSLSSTYTDFYDDHLKEKGLELSEVNFWGTYWFNWGAECLLSEVDFRTYQCNPDFKYPFICLNNRSHLHRCAIMDELTKNNLIEKGVVTFHDFLEENKEYPFQYFKRRQLTLNDNFHEKLDSFIIPKEFHNSFLHIVTEAHHECCLLTEKVVKPLLLKKPFLVLGNKGYHKILYDLGFKLYDEIFDYSFDTENDLLKRTEKLVSNIPVVLDKNLTELYKILEDKINYNYNRAIEIINDKSFIPNFVKERIHNPEIEQVFNDGRNLQLLNRYF